MGRRRRRPILARLRAAARFCLWKSRDGAGVGGAVHLPQALLAHLRVHLGGRDRGVPEHLLHHAQVGAVVEHVGGAAVAQHVRRQVLAAGRPARRPYFLIDRPRRLAGQPAAATVEEHRLGVVAPAPLRGASASPGRRARTTRRAPRRPRRPNGTMRSFEPLPNRRTSWPSKSMSPIDSPHASEMRAPVPYSSSSSARSRRVTGSSPTHGVEQARRRRPRCSGLGIPAGTLHPFELGRRVVGAARPRSRGGGAACASPPAGGRPTAGADPDARRAATKSTSVVGADRLEVEPASSQPPGVRRQVAAVGGDAC